MLALIAITLPPVIMAALWRKLEGGICDLKNFLLSYTVSLLLVNVLDMFIFNLLTRSSFSLTDQINGFSGFAMKYILMSCFFAVSIPYAVRYCRDNIRLTLRREETTTFYFPWRAASILYTVLLFGMNFIRIFDNNFCGDEGYSIMLSKMSVTDMLSTTALDVHPPLYYLLLMGFCRIFGGYGWVYHVVSILPYGLCLIFIMTVIWKRFGKGSAFLLVTLASLVSNAVTYNVEARMYSLAAMFMLFAYYAFYKIITDEEISSYIFFVLASLGAAYSHYYAMMAVAFFYLGLLVMVVRKKLKIRTLLAVYLATIVGYMPWMVQMITTFQRTADNFWIEQAQSVKDGLLYYFLSERVKFSWLMLFLSIGIVAVLMVADKKIVSVNTGGVKTEIRLGFPSEKLSDTTVWLLWGLIASLGTLGLAQLISVLVRPAFAVRYLYPVSILMWAVLSIGLSRIKFTGKFLLPLVLLLVLAVCGLEYQYTYNYEKQLNDICTSTQEYMLNNIGSSDMMLTNGSQLGWTILRYYIPDVSYKTISSGYSDFDPDTVYWLVWENDLSEEEQLWLAEYGYCAVEVYHGGVFGSNFVHIYRMEENVESDLEQEVEAELRTES